MEIKDIKVRGMNFEEFEKYHAFLEERDKKDKEAETAGENKDAINLKSRMEISKWIMKEIYGVDVKDLNCTVATVLTLTSKTESLSFENELADEKNSEVSGTGE